jgi:hypothetical protein
MTLVPDNFGDALWSEIEMARQLFRGDAVQ